MAGPAEVVDVHQPFGEVSVTHVAGESPVVPVGSVFHRRGYTWTPHGSGGIVATPTGYAALAPIEFGSQMTIAVSPDGISWQLLDNGPTLERGRLFEAGGWYWMEAHGDAALFRSADLGSWEEIELAGTSPGGQGVPVTERSWNVYGDQLVAFAHPRGLLTVDLDSGLVKTVDAPWEFPPDGHWKWLAISGGRLSAYISSIPDVPATVVDPTVEVYTTEDLESWSGPMTPPMVIDEGRGLLVHGAEDPGLIAMAYGEILAWTELYFSSDGDDWQSFDVPDAFYPRIGFEPTLDAVRIGDRPGLGGMGRLRSSAPFVRRRDPMAIDPTRLAYRTRRDSGVGPRCSELERLRREDLLLRTGGHLDELVGHQLRRRRRERQLIGTPPQGAAMRPTTKRLLFVSALGVLVLACAENDPTGPDEAALPPSTTTVVEDADASSTTTSATAPASSTTEAVAPTGDPAVDPKVETALETARAFMQGLADRDLETVTSHAMEGHVFGLIRDAFDRFPEEFAWLDAIGWTITVDECEITNPDPTNTKITCDVSHENAWSRALDVGPYRGEFPMRSCTRATSTWGPRFNDRP